MRTTKSAAKIAMTRPDNSTKQVKQVDGIEAANRQIARWPKWKREALFRAFGLQ